MEAFDMGWTSPSTDGAVAAATEDIVRGDKLKSDGILYVSRAELELRLNLIGGPNLSKLADECRNQNCG